jgi:tryptophan halogenase
VAALNRRKDGPDTEFTVIESSNLTIIDVGEKTTLSTFLTFAQLRIDETDFLHHCDATFKGAVRFKGWGINSDSSDGDYYHPFDALQSISGIHPAYHYHRHSVLGARQPSFAHAMSVLPTLVDANRAPKLLGSDPFEGLTNYSFHLDTISDGRVSQALLHLPWQHLYQRRRYGCDVGRKRVCFCARA